VMARFPRVVALERPIPQPHHPPHPQLHS
jgi:hypothetical protein